MRLKPEESKKLAQHLTNLIVNDKTVTLKTSRQKIQDTIEKVLLHHSEEERQIEQKSEKLYQERSGEFGTMDKGKALAMIRKQVAKENDDFILSGAPEGRFSEDKISHMAHLVADTLFDDDLLDFKDEDEGPQFTKRVFTQYFGKEDEINEKVRKKILGMNNAPFEGSRDWDILFRKYYEEEMRRISHG
ncbi:MAG: hypothetical protein JWQ35_542 [Bacteriovoracaceae bacterium]|nr:hypothetical protein [Bacteriovoracaceae bacterium]